MKKRNILLVLTLLFIGFSAIAQNTKINWMTLDEALAAQTKNPKKIMMDAYTVWCGPCKMLDKNTFQNPDVAAYVNKNYYAVKFNAEGNEEVNYLGKTYTNPNYDASRSGRNAQHQLAQAFQIRAYPTILFFDEKGNPIVPLPGYKTPQQLEIYLKLFLENGHQKIKTQEEWNQYQKDFKYEFEG